MPGVIVRNGPTMVELAAARCRSAATSAAETAPGLLPQCRGEKLGRGEMPDCLQRAVNSRQTVKRISPAA